jgi:hypothetical protein
MVPGDGGKVCLRQLADSERTSMPASSSDRPALRPTTSGQRVSQGWSGVKRGGWGMGIDWVSSLRLVRGTATALTACRTRPREPLLASRPPSSLYIISKKDNKDTGSGPLATRFVAEACLSRWYRWCAALLVSHWSVHNMLYDLDECPMKPYFVAINWPGSE